MTNLDALNENQREAVVSDDKRLLVLAGAGSGKTKTLLQKIIYLIEEKHVSPHDILAITFTKNAANEMLDRLILVADTTGTYEKLLYDKKKSRDEKDAARRQFAHNFKWINGLTIRTFHSFGYYILRNLGVNEFDNKFRIITDEKIKEGDEFLRYTAPESAFDMIHKLIIQRCEDIPYLLQLKRYILDYLVDKIHLKQSNWNPQVRDGKFYTSLDGTKVRSKSEQFIADYLFRHNITFQYEAVLNVRDFDFRPDFFIPEANLYIEHVSKKSFPMRGKETQFEKGGMLFVKTFESMAEDSAYFNHVLDNIFRGRLSKSTDSSKKITYQEAFKGNLDHVRDFITLVLRVTDLIKVENTDTREVLTNAQTDPHERVRHFYELAIPIIEDYKNYCVDKSYMDFNDLISRSVSLMKNQDDVAHKIRDRYKYVLVDEFQDVNNLQVELIKLLVTEDTQLFCVGDDWQSIYGFRGSNVSYIIEFENQFPNAKVIKLNLNYRSTQNIVGASNEVIKKNKFKIEKDIKSAKMSEHKIVVYAGNNEDDNKQYCLERVQEFLNEGIAKEEILFLYRRTKMGTPYFDYLKDHSISVPFKTIHAAKGLEAKVVFIVGLTDGPGGFPDIWLEDRIFQTIKKANFDLLLEEERRLFYVAITRAKDKLFLITEKGAESVFLKEIPDNYTVRTGVPLKSVVEEVRTCSTCFSVLENLFAYCPYCGAKQENV
ncbi:MAG: ATP-dependent helicase [Saprospiraceae bacterium]|nr:ATP-dependent helicase [Saprospiraceae bacterium]